MPVKNIPIGPELEVLTDAIRYALRSRKTSHFETTSLPSIYFQSNMIFRDYRTIETVFFLFF